MSLIRCNQLLCRKTSSLLNLFKQSAVYYSDDKKSSDDGEQSGDNVETEKATEKPVQKKNASDSIKSAPKTASAESQKRLSDLLKKLSNRTTLGIVKDVQASKPMGYKKLREIQNLDEKVAKPKRIKDAAMAVSKELGDNKIMGEILEPLGSNAKESDPFDDIIVNMKNTARSATGGFTSATRKPEPSKPSTGAFTQDNKPREGLIRRRQTIRPQFDATRYDSTAESVTKAFDGQPIGIFDVNDVLEVKDDSLKTWNKLEKHELQLKMSLAPRNYFEKMAHWTQEGKIWKFPIDNEQGLDEELQTPFTEHIFLEDYIESWCPKKGSVHNFMELICIGLSKNPYLSVKQKHEHLDWYRDYFEAKRDILQRVIEANKTNTTAQVEGGTTNS